MGLTRRIVLLLLFSLISFIPTTVFAASANDEVVFGGDYELLEDDVLNGDLLIFGGNVVIHAGGQVNGNVTQVGGTIRIDGRVDGDVSQVGGSLVLGENAHISGDIINNGGSIRRDEGSHVDGNIRTGFQNIEVRRKQPGTLGSFILDSLWTLFVIFSSAALAVVITLLWPKRLQTVGQAITSNPVMSGGTGLLVLAVATPLLILILFTVILIPVSFIGFVVIAAACAFGWAALSCEIGLRLAGLANQSWSPALAAGLGAILLGMIYVGMARIPCIGWALQAMVTLIGLGAVTLTQFGGEAYLENSIEPGA